MAKLCLPLLAVALVNSRVHHLRCGPTNTFLELEALAPLVLALPVFIEKENLHTGSLAERATAVERGRCSDG